MLETLKVVFLSLVSIATLVTTAYVAPFLWVLPQKMELGLAVVVLMFGIVEIPIAGLAGGYLLQTFLLWYTGKKWDFLTR